MQYKLPRTVERERLVHAAHRFAKICRNNPVKLFALLYMLDIRFFRETGRSCTGETYYAMADGPAPGTLRPLLVMRDLDLDTAIELLTCGDSGGPWPFDAGQYCPRGLTILRDLETRYANANSRDLSLGDANAWWRIYTRSQGVGAAIPYEMTLPGIDWNPAERKRLGRWLRGGEAGWDYRDPATSPAASE
jgi:hypothetical protein